MATILFTTIACSKDDDGPTGRNNPAVGTWTRQIQWAYTNGTRDDSYILKAGGRGTYKHWDWGDQKYKNNSLTWECAANVVLINIEDDADTHYSERIGLINSSGTAMQVYDYWYYKQ